MWIKKDSTNFLLRKLNNAFKKMNHENFANALNIHNMMDMDFDKFGWNVIRWMNGNKYWKVYHEVFKSETNATDVIIGLVVYQPSRDWLKSNLLILIPLKLKGFDTYCLLDVYGWQKYSKIICKYQMKMTGSINLKSWWNDTFSSSSKIWI